MNRKKIKDFFVELIIVAWFLIGVGFIAFRGEFTIGLMCILMSQNMQMRQELKELKK